MKLTIFWFRRDLRIEDNTGLYYALKNQQQVLPLFIFDTKILNKLENPHDARVEFIHNEIIRLDNELQLKGSSLLVKHGNPEKLFKEIIEQFDISSVYANHDYEPYATERDNKIKKLLESKGINFFTYKDQVIFEKNEVLNDSGQPYKVYTSYKNKWINSFNNELIKPFHSERLNNFLTSTPFTIPTLKEIGFQKTNIEIPERKFPLSIIKSYDKTRDFPYIEGTSRLGIHLRFGTISVRKAVKVGYQYNETWLKELIWREFFMQLLFHFPDVVNEPFNKKFKNLPWRYNDKDFQKWCEGKTGYPLVDAGMRQLNAIGFMHNRVRMVCASFLAKHLLLDWRLGEKYFADKLLDFELSSNNGNWQWSAGTGADAQPFFRIFNPELQQKKFDPEFIYIKTWVPEFGTSSYPNPMIDHKSAVDRAKRAFNIIR